MGQKSTFLIKLAMSSLILVAETSQTLKQRYLKMKASLHYAGNVFTMAPANRTDFAIFSDAKSALQLFY